MSVGYLAGERLFASVRAQMLFEKHLPGEGLVADRAAMWPLSRVDAHVHVVRHSLVETLPTLCARVLLAVAVDLHV